MSKRDRANRFADSPDFQELPRIGTENKAESSTLPSSLSKSAPIVVETSEEDEDRVYFQKMCAFFGGCWNKIVTFSAALSKLSKAVIFKPWGWCRSSALWAWRFLRTIPSYCVIRWSSEKKKDESAETVTDAKKEIKPVAKNDPLKTEAKLSDIKPISTISASDHFDEDEPTTSRWWSVGIKTAAATVALLILGGGYFVIKPLMFPPSTSDIETVAITDQTLPEGTQQSAPDTKSIAAAVVSQQQVPQQRIPKQKIAEPPAAPATVSPLVAEAAPAAKQPPAFPEPSPQPEKEATLSQATLEPSQESLLQGDLFAAAPSVPSPPSVPTITESSVGDVAVPPAVSDPFGTAMSDSFAEPPASMPPSSMPAEPVPAISQSAPLNNTVDNSNAAGKAVAKSAATEEATAKSLAVLQPLPSLETAQASNSQPQLQQSQLQPLAALDSSASSSTLPSVAQTSPAPIASQSSANAPIASNFRDRRNNRRVNANPSNANPSFEQAPSPPSVVSTIPESNTAPAVPVSEIPIAEPVNEIIPQIPHTGMVQEVPPPVVPPIAPPITPPAAETASVQTMTSEPAPAIPKDSPNQTENAVSLPSVAEPESMDASVLPYLSVNESPIDQSLRERLREQREEEAKTEPAKLRFTAKAATPEPALRFSSKKESTPPAATSAKAHEGNLLMSESVNQFRDLLPSEASSTLSPDSTDIVVTLPVLENAPPPVFADIRPAYRGGQGTSEKGLTFQSRIDSEIKRSPSTTETYVIQQGDTYMTISDRFYGTSLLYTALAAHNQKSGIGWRPTEGVVIEVPTAEYLRSNYGDATHRQERRLAAQRSAIRYIVQEGDTIFRLATDKLQDSTRWKEIYALNTDRIQDVRILQPGMEILLPAETAR